MGTTRKKSTKPSKRLKRISKRLTAYTAAAAATVATTQDSVNGAEVVHDIPDVFISGLGIQFNMISGETAPATASFSNSIEGSFRVGSAFFAGYLEIAGPANSLVGFVGPGGYGAFYFYADRLEVGSLIGADRSFGGRTDFPSYGTYGFLNSASGGEFFGTRGIVGIAFNISDVKHFGWAEISGPVGGQSLHGFGYNDEPGAASLSVETREILGDFDGNKILDAADWAVLRDNNQADLGLDPDVAASLGDLDGDLDNDIDDFDLFRVSYETENPGAAFADMVAASSVPEPSSIMLLAAGAAGMGTWRKRRAQESS